ncbi:MAG: class I SAM-dependent methyltransferase family protein [Candidatus Bathyarchaeia archaeon]
MARKSSPVFKAFSGIVGEDQAGQISKGIDVVGDIAIIKSPSELGEKNRLLGEALLREMPSIKVVLRQSSPVKGELRLREVEWLAGERRTITVHKEFGCRYHVDVAKAYFSPRLSAERSRVSEDIRQTFKGPSEVVINMFAGVGCFSILIAKMNRNVKVYSIDVNPEAVQFMLRNIRLNKVSRQVTAGLADAATLVEACFAGRADRVLMPLPERAYQYLPQALNALRKGGVIYYQLFVHADKGEDPIKKSEEETRKLMRGIEHDLKSRIIREVGPYWYQIAQDITVYAI